MCETDDEHSDIGTLGNAHVSIVMIDLHARKGCPQSVQRGHHIARDHIAGPTVAQICDCRQTADHRHPAQCLSIQRQQCVLIAQQHDRRRCGLARQGPMSGTVDHCWIDVLRQHRSEPQQRGDDSRDCGVD